MLDVGCQKGRGDGSRNSENGRQRGGGVKKN